jgi:hypothetical protein
MYLDHSGNNRKSGHFSHTKHSISSTADIGTAGVYGASLKLWLAMVSIAAVFAVVSVSVAI